MNKHVKDILSVIIPNRLHLPLWYWFRKFKGTLDQEMFVASTFLENHRRFLDIGSNVGIYSYYFAKSMDQIDAFEPLIEASSRLSATNLKNVSIHNIALSNRCETKTFYIPIANRKLVTGLATLEEKPGNHVERIINVTTLDEFKYDDVDLIKIDVEGHEIHVIRGAIHTIKRCKPVIIVEIEQCHIKVPITDIFQEIIDLGYDGYFLIDRELRSIGEFDYEKHQKPYLSNVLDRHYVNNFIFKAIPT
jgi:FkbM family methyltransferase